MNVAFFNPWAYNFGYNNTFRNLDGRVLPRNVGVLSGDQLIEREKNGNIPGRPKSRS
jgi:hypothetical protein